MKFAMVDDIKTEAKKGAKGTCPLCGSELIAKCGEIKIHHWSHKGIRNCDPWWEPETEWHRSWKNKFPKEWQEVSMKDPKSGEMHRADLLAVHNLVVEFQHSQIDPKERVSREFFYKNMVWVVDGTRLKNDYSRFSKGINSFIHVDKRIFKVDSPQNYFPPAWLASSVPVIFDFHSYDSSSEQINSEKSLYCLFPVKIGRTAFMEVMPISSFVNEIISGIWFRRTSQNIHNMIQVKREQEEQAAKAQRQRDNLIFQKYVGGYKDSRKRKF